MIRTLAAYFVFTLILSATAAGEVKPVMLFLSAKDQPDTLGYNLVTELPAMLYSALVEGRIPLWDSPEKQIQILPASLKAIEESNDLSFAASPRLFILEKWTLGKKMLRCEPTGFYFSDRSKTGEEISYGFVDYSDAELSLTSTAINANANGSCFETFKYILLNHLYFYNIVQFGNKKVTSLEESQRIKRQYAAALTDGINPSPATKKIAYKVEKPGAEEVSLSTGAATYELLKMIEDFLNNNKEVYLNFGGDKISDFHTLNGAQSVIVRSIEAEEIWTRNDTGGMDTQLIALTVNLEGGPLAAFTPEDLWKLDIRSGEKSLLNLLKQKEFYFRILSINADLISKEESPKYLKALKKFSWNQVKEFVKYD
jgi:hypothetical protein